MNYPEYRKYIISLLPTLRMACHKKERNLWVRQMRLAIAAGATDETLAKLNPNYKPKEFAEQIHWFRRTEITQARGKHAFLAFAKSIGAPSFTDYIQGGRGTTQAPAARPSSENSKEDGIAVATSRPLKNQSNIRLVHISRGL